MKASIYLNYISRSLLRGGQRTVLAIFCVAIGVLAVVSLQLVGFMLQNSFTRNARELNGGDLSVTSQSQPFKASDLSFFDHLKNNGTITNYSALIEANAALQATSSSAQTFFIEGVDPHNFPLVSAPSFVQPANGSIAKLLGNDQVLVTQHFLDRYQKKVGATFSVYVKSAFGSGQTISVTVVGVIANTGIFSQAGNLLLIAQQDYLANAPASLANYTTIAITTADRTHTDTAVKAINDQFPLAMTQTASDLLKTTQSSIDGISKFLEISGLLALLIGGVGIVNTMQVLLSRRKTEIAMLKTAGYKRRNLYTLFGLEAALLGLIGGIIGAGAAIGVSYLVHNLMQSLGISFVFLLDPWIILSGVGIGFATSLIFGLMPIVQAAQARPLSVIRDMPGHNARSTVLTVFLLTILSVLFCALSTVILHNDVTLGIEATYGTFAFLLALGGIFSLIVFLISKLPVPERLNVKQILLVLLGIAVSVLVFQALPVFGLFMLAFSVFGCVIALTPRSWKVSTKMALRNIGRRRARTMATMLALFIGIFCIGLVVGLGVGVQTQIADDFTQKLPYNIIATTSGADTKTLQTSVQSIPGLKKSRQDTFTSVVPVAINDQPVQNALPTGGDRQKVINLLSGIDGYNLAQNVPDVVIRHGRDLNSSDAGTNNVVVNELLTSTGQLHMNLKVGDTLTLFGEDGKTKRSVTIVGIYSINDSYTNIGDVLAPTELTNALSSPQSGAISVFYMKIDVNQVNHALDTIGQTVPNAQVQNLVDVGAAFAQQIQSLLEMLVAIASLSVMAAVIIIANAVALAMLERRRELGILKSVGYTSSTVLSEVVIENGIVGGTGSFLATLLAAAAIALVGNSFYNQAFTISPIVVVSLILGSSLLAMFTAALVAWGSVRVRPLAVLRYE